MPSFVNRKSDAPLPPGAAESVTVKVIWVVPASPSATLASWMEMTAGGTCTGAAGLRGAPRAPPADNAATARAASAGAGAARRRRANAAALSTGGR